MFGSLLDSSVFKGAPMAQEVDYGSAQHTNQYYDPISSIPEKRVSSDVFAGLRSKPFVTAERRRLNVYPMLFSVLLPWGLFVLTFWLSSFSFRYEEPPLYRLVIYMLGLIVAVFTLYTVANRLHLWQPSGDREPSWLLCLAISLVIAFAAGLVLGGRNYREHTRNYYDFGNLNSYHDIYPNLFRGQQLMDAGVVSFTRDTHLDISKSEGFKDGTVYCVAPIVLGNETLSTYDFWAVGTGCCSGHQADFHCTGRQSYGWGGLRLMDSGARSKYRLAVQQAEATHGIRAAHPLFFTWTKQPHETVQNWQTQAVSTFQLYIFASLLFQVFWIATVVLVFTRYGSSK